MTTNSAELKRQFEEFAAKEAPGYLAMGYWSNGEYQSQTLQQWFKVFQAGRTAAQGEQAGSAEQVSEREASQLVEWLDVDNHRLRRTMQKMMARLADLLDEDQFAEFECLVSATGVDPHAANGFSPMDEWVDYAKRSGLLDENGVATDTHKTQVAWFAFTAAWNLRAALSAPERKVTDEADQALLISMACCLNHGFGMDSKEQQERQLYDMRKLYDEMAGNGFYSPENRERYLSMLNDESHRSPTDILNEFFNQQGEQTAPEWISAEDRLPEPGTWLVAVETDDGIQVHTLELNKKRQWIHEGEPTFCHSYMFHPTHWLPLPAAPSAAQKEESK